MATCKITSTTFSDIAWERICHRIAILGFDLAILIAMALLLVGSVLAMGGSIRIYQASVLLPVVCMVLALGLKAWRRPACADVAATARQGPDIWKEEIRHILRDWLPFLFIVFIYENLHDLAGQVTGFDFAATLNRLDIALFGVEPTVWAQKIFSPLLTDIMAISYGLYFALPLFIMFLLTLWERRNDFRQMALCLMLVFLMGFLGYVFLPTSPPRYFIEQLYTDPPRLYGLFIYNHLQSAWDGLSVISGGAFPSLHVGLSAVALLYAFRFRNLNRTCRIVWYAYIPLTLSLWFSTVYLRHHWVIDIFAGWAVCLIGYLGAVLMMRTWVTLRRKYGLPF